MIQASKLWNANKSDKSCILCRAINFTGMDGEWRKDGKNVEQELYEKFAKCHFFRRTRYQSISSSSFQYGDCSVIHGTEQTDRQAINRPDHFFPSYLLIFVEVCNGRIQILLFYLLLFSISP